MRLGAYDVCINYFTFLRNVCIYLLAHNTLDSMNAHVSRIDHVACSNSVIVVVTGVVVARLMLLPH